MPIYTYRREDGTTFEIRQKFLDDPLEVDPETGQQVQRVIHATGIIFKGSGYYVTDNRGANNPAAKNSSSNSTENNGSSANGSNGANDANGASNKESQPAKTEAAAD